MQYPLNTQQVTKVTIMMMRADNDIWMVGWWDGRMATGTTTEAITMRTTNQRIEQQEKNDNQLVMIAMAMAMAAMTARVTPKQHQAEATTYDGSSDGSSKTMQQQVSAWQCRVNGNTIELPW